jgi:hypothetical protein
MTWGAGHVPTGAEERPGRPQRCIAPRAMKAVAVLKAKGDVVSVAATRQKLEAIEVAAPQPSATATSASRPRIARLEPPR